jgi:3,4-dihydroxy 2-butanone 4-phosphate synthase / GTP cyclohydrolase II
MRISIEEAIKQLKNGKMLIVVDDENRENEGDLVYPAETITPDLVNFIVTKGRGLVCVALEEDRAKTLQLNKMTTQNTALHSTNFTVTVDALEGTESGISALDRSITIKKLADSKETADSFGRPGHISPIIAKPGGVLRRSGHTEATVDLMKLAGFEPVGVLCEILDDDGTMARIPSLERFGKEHNISIVTIEDLIRYRHNTERLVDKILVTDMPTKFGIFQLHLYVNHIDNKEHFALIKGDITTPEPVLVRVHDQCLTGDCFGSLRCDCGEQLGYAMQQIEDEGRGVLLYMSQEGRGIGIVNKLKAYVLQDEGYDTVDANLKLGLKADEREYGIGAQILSSLGISKMRIMTNNPMKIHGLDAFGLEITERIPIKVGKNKYNTHYLQTKEKRMGHML